MADFQIDIFGGKVEIPDPSQPSPKLGEGGRFAPGGVVFNPAAIFAFTDAVAARQKKESWVLYQKALASGTSAEELFFKIVWQIKTLLIAKRTNSVEETEMKEYPYKKAKASLRNFKDGELEKLSAYLTAGYHEARRGKGEIETLIEKMLLRL